ncbi:MAG: urease accessory protein UreE [Gammaproteobacteria bacterium]|nr:urease accessory protein UreE [Gammaproteobacteria bacterium]
MLLKLTELASTQTRADDSLTLPFEFRQKSRFSATTDNGRAVGLFLKRGQVLRSGMVVTGPNLFSVLINAASEPVSVLYCDDLLQITRAAYHLGNRHVPLQILKGELRYLRDHVLDAMLEQMHLSVEHVQLPFEPETGAYHGHHHQHD